jgi:hypothetical protein
MSKVELLIGSVTTMGVQTSFVLSAKYFCSLWQSSGKICTLTLYFAAIFPYVGQCLELGMSYVLFVNDNAYV